MFIQAVFFIIATLFCFWLPGLIASEALSLRLNELERLFFPPAVGMVLFTLLSYGLDSLGRVWLTVPILLVICAVGLWNKNVRRMLFQVPREVRLRDLWPILVMSLLFTIPAVTSGKFGESIRFVGVNGTDSYWHLSLMNELSRHFPPQDPGVSGHMLSGYHFFSDYVLAKFHGLFGFSPLFLLFQFFPVFTAIVWGGMVYVLALAWSKKQIVAYWAVFMTMFGGSFSFLVPLFGGMHISPNSGFGMLQPSTSLVNPSFTFSIVLLSAGLFALYKHFSTHQSGWLLVVALVFGVISEFKVYAGIVTLGVFVLLTIWNVVHKRWVWLVALGLVAGLFYATYWRFTGSAGFLVWRPLWPPRDIMQASFPSFNFDLKRQYYASLGDTFRLARLDILAFVLYMLGNSGVRLLALLLLFRRFRPTYFKHSAFTYTLLGMLAISYIIPMFFIQSIKPIEITQLFNYVLFFGALFTAAILGVLWERVKGNLLKAALVTGVVGLSLPHVLTDFAVYADTTPHTVSPRILEATKFLKNHDSYEAIIQEVPTSGISLDKKGVAQWYRTYSFHVFNALAVKRSYLTNSHYYFPDSDIDRRIDFVFALVQLNSTPQGQISSLVRQSVLDGLQRDHISYLYARAPLTRLVQELGIKQVFANEEVYIYSVR